MIRGILIFIITCLCVTFGPGSISYAEPTISPALKEKIEKHIEKVKCTKPTEYEAMVQRAGGSITGCRSCHDKVGKEKKPSNPPPSDFPNK